MQIQRHREGREGLEVTGRWGCEHLHHVNDSPRVCVSGGTCLLQSHSVPAAKIKPPRSLAFHKSLILLPHLVALQILSFASHEAFYLRYPARCNSSTVTMGMSSSDIGTKYVVPAIGSVVCKWMWSGVRGLQLGA